jgi:hypothetical protein
MAVTIAKNLIAGLSIKNKKARGNLKKETKFGRLKIIKYFFVLEKQVQHYLR